MLPVCLSDTDYWAIGTQREEAACQFITVSRTEQNKEFVCAQRDSPVCVCVRALNLPFLQLSTKMYVCLMNREHLALLGWCAHVHKHAHIRREYKKTNFQAYEKMAGQGGFSHNSRTRQSMSRHPAKHGAVAPDNHTQLTDANTMYFRRTCTSCLSLPCLSYVPLIPTLKQAPQTFLPFVWAHYRTGRQESTQYTGGQRQD